jgi:serine/threonine protein kinase
MIPHASNINGVAKLERMLGKGSFGTVWKGIWNGKDIAVKEITLDSVKSSIFLETEISALYQAKTSGCLQYVAEIYDVLFDCRLNRLYFLMELVKGEDLKSFIKGHSAPTQDDAIAVLSMLRIGLDCLHRNFIAHRDIKPANVMIDASVGIVKWIDFGLSCVSSPPESQCDGRLVGTPATRAPEVYADTRYDLSSFPLLNGVWTSIAKTSFEMWRSADIWSFGCLAHELINDGAVYPLNRVMALNHKEKRPMNIFKAIESELRVGLAEEQGNSPFQRGMSGYPKVHPFLMVCLQIDPIKRYQDYSQFSF